jgi:FkbM family methyltransferase
MPRNDLIFDVGANNGDDTAAYLGRGYNVVAVEANPSLCLDLRARFQHELGLGRLTLAEGAIAERPGDVFSPFAIGRQLRRVGPLQSPAGLWRCQFQARPTLPSP